MIPVVHLHLPAISPTPIEQAPPGEADAIDAMIDELERQLTEHYITPRQMPVRRDAHPKLVGLVRATFTVNDDCPPELRHGVFARPGLPLSAEIRYSNGYPKVQHDYLADVRGMAMKIHGLKDEFLPGLGPDQDFMLATAEAFFGTNAVDFVDFLPVAENKLGVLRYFLGGLRLRGFWNLFLSMQTPPSPLAADYFSQTPYRLGPHAVKYAVRPAAPRRTNSDPWYMLPVVRPLVSFLFPLGARRLFTGIPADAMARALERDLAEPVQLDLMIQRWPDLSRIPAWAIEDATRVWPAPWQRAATIELTPGWRIGERAAEAERMTFSPWHALRVQQPLGSINRARYAVYRTMSAFRNMANGVSTR